MPDLDPITGTPDSRPEDHLRSQSSSRARDDQTNPVAAEGNRPTPQRSELHQIGRRFEVALRHPFHTPDRDPERVEQLRRRGRKLLEKQAQHAAERRRGPQGEEPGRFSLARLRNRLAGKVQDLLSRQEPTQAKQSPSR